MMHLNKAKELLYKKNYLEAEQALLEATKQNLSSQETMEAYENLLRVYKALDKKQEIKDTFNSILSRFPEKSTEIIISKANLDLDLLSAPEIQTLKELEIQENLGITNFVLHKIYEEEKDFNKSFSHLKNFNTELFKQRPYNKKTSQEFYETQKKIFNEAFLKKLVKEQENLIKNGYQLDETVPVFVLGFPRSGTSLTEQILASHSQVHGAGEIYNFGNICNKYLARSRPAFQEIIKDLDAEAFLEIGKMYLEELKTISTKKYIVNKMPYNYFNIALIRLMLPQAKIINTVRNPIATCFSNYKRFFTSGNNHSFDLDACINEFKLYQNLMNHWHENFETNFLMDFSYEELIENQTEKTKDLLEYLGLELEEKCLEFYKNERAVETASSSQVKQALYKNSLDVWLNYQSHIGPLIKAFSS